MNNTVKMALAQSLNVSVEEDSLVKAIIVTSTVLIMALKPLTFFMVTSGHLNASFLGRYF